MIEMTIPTMAPDAGASAVARHFSSLLRYMEAAGLSKAEAYGLLSVYNYGAATDYADSFIEAAGRLAAGTYMLTPCTNLEIALGAPAIKNRSTAVNKLEKGDLLAVLWRGKYQDTRETAALLLRDFQHLSDAEIVELVIAHGEPRIRVILALGIKSPEAAWYLLVRTSDVEVISVILPRVSVNLVLNFLEGRTRSKIGLYAPLESRLKWAEQAHRRARRKSLRERAGALIVELAP